MPSRFLLASLVAMLAFFAGTYRHASAQSLPLTPIQLTAEIHAAGTHERTWKVGPILLELPESWVDTSRERIVSLTGPEKTVATFVASEATKTAREGGYSVLTDTARGPESFLKYVQWDDCEGTPARIAKPLAAPPGSKAMLAQCTVEARPGALSNYAQVAIYSPIHVVQIHVIGSSEVVASFLRALERAKWKSET